MDVQLRTSSRTSQQSPSCDMQKHALPGAYVGGRVGPAAGEPGPRRARGTWSGRASAAARHCALSWCARWRHPPIGSAPPSQTALPSPPRCATASARSHAIVSLMTKSAVVLIVTQRDIDSMQARARRCMHPLTSCVNENASETSMHLLAQSASR